MRPGMYRSGGPITTGESTADSNIIGMLARDITVYVDLKEGMTIGSFLEEIREQVMIGISYSCYPHANVVPDSDLSLCVIYQSELGEEEQNTVLSLRGVELPSPCDSNEALIDMEIYDTEEGTEIVFSYLPLCYKEESMNRFRRMVMKSAPCWFSMLKNRNERSTGFWRS